MLQGIIDFFDKNTVAIVVGLIVAVSGAAVVLVLKKTSGAVGKAAGWLWAKRPFRKRAWLLIDSTLTIEETFDKELEAWQAQLEFAQTDDEKARNRLEMGQVVEAKAAYYRASRELSLPQAVRERMEALASRRETRWGGASPSGVTERPGRTSRAFPEDATGSAASSFRVPGIQPSPRTTTRRCRRACRPCGRANAFGGYEEALADYNLSLELRPDDPSTLNNKGVALSHSERRWEALADFTRVLELRPNPPTTLSNRGGTLGNLELYEEALGDLNRSPDLRPDDPTTLYNRRIALGHLERYEEALADFNRSLGLRPDDPDTLNSRGITLDHLERCEEALADFNRVLELRPDYPDTLSNRGATMAHLERYDEALADHNRSLVLRPDAPTPSTI